MKLRNKRTGDAVYVDFRIPLCNSDRTLGSYSITSLKELNKHFEDYKPAGPKRYRLLEDLPTFKAGEIFEIFNGNLYKVNETDDDTEYEVMAYHQKTLEKFPNILTDWFEPVYRDLEETRHTGEPLIKDEKIRKAVKAWAEATKINGCSYDDFWKSFRFDNCDICFKGEYDFDELLDEEYHTIAELCGEEEE